MRDGNTPTDASQSPPTRLDKWLWATRVFKTRSLAAEACRNGHVTIDGHDAKPSRDVRSGEIFQIKQAGLTRSIKVIAVLNRRVSAKEAVQYIEDLTAPKEYEKYRENRRQTVFVRDPGQGRPTKRDRRKLDSLF